MLTVTLTDDEARTLRQKLQSAISNIRTADASRVQQGREPAYAERIAYLQTLLAKLTPAT